MYIYGCTVEWKGLSQEDFPESFFFFLTIFLIFVSGLSCDMQV